MPGLPRHRLLRRRPGRRKSGRIRPDEDAAKAQNLALIARINALVDEDCHNDGNQYLKQNLKADKDRRQDGRFFVVADGGCDVIDYGVSLLLLG